MEIASLQRQNPGVTIDLSKYGSGNSPYFLSVADAQNFIDSVKAVMLATINVPEKEVIVSSGSNQKFASCGCGDYSAGAGSAGLFSSFSVAFSYCNGSVSNATINTSGLQIGWTLGGTSSSYSGLYGCSTATATFSIGIFSWNQIVRIQWHFNPNSCTFYYNIGSGPCGGILY